MLAVARRRAGPDRHDAALGLLRALHPSNLPRLGEIDVDGRVLVFTALTCLATTLVFGLAPALQAARQDPQRCPQGGGRAGTGRRGSGCATLLILGEVALSVVLLVGAGLLVRSFVALQQVRPGFDASRRPHLPVCDAGGPLPERGRRAGPSSASSSASCASCPA